MIALTGHIMWGSPLQARPMTLPRTPFFWFVKVREAKRACWACSVGAIDDWMQVSPMKSWTSASLKRVLLLTEEGNNYLSAVAQNAASDVDVDWTRKVMQCMTGMGMGLTWSGAG
jgi:hypothetical protein